MILTSSFPDWVTDDPCSVAHHRPFLSHARPCALRCPYEYIRLSKGLPDAAFPVSVTLRIFPARLFLSCASDGSCASPVAMYRFPSGPKAILPPLWLAAPGIPSSITFSLVSRLPSQTVLTTRLSVSLPLPL